jgi:hypothetical protein
MTGGALASGGETAAAANGVPVGAASIRTVVTAKTILTSPQTNTSVETISVPPSIRYTGTASDTSKQPRLVSPSPSIQNAGSATDTSTKDRPASPSTGQILPTTKVQTISSPKEKIDPKTGVSAKDLSTLPSMEEIGKISSAA